eukprot:gnl/TRDRNA2_/TRDRNA2_179391_c0_seq1.p1 gnl/TRDRNA2_/TRDRNA2_179391_c0~~gnl/TRDRNA2_/TRDRNA2_179391_c0_seq1.p1  ORF type:complete len:434 (+),score=118.76 gnl/TRDRNA2_/TRDRNA2_179391_c0_seq1:70-1302(+)
MAEAAVEALAFPVDKKKYIIHNLDPVLDEMITALLKEMPKDPSEFMIQWLRKRSGITMPKHFSAQSYNAHLKKELKAQASFVADCGAATGKADSRKASKDKKEDEESEEEDDDEDAPDIDAMAPPPGFSQRQRQSVSAEAYGVWNKATAFTAPVHPKTDAQKESLKGILQKSFMFSTLEPKELEVVINAVKQVSFKDGDRIIKEGDDGDCLYIIEEGTPNCKKKIDGVEKIVKECVPGDVFGELALLYNAPRAASVDAVGDCNTWSLDRESFNAIVKESAQKNAGKYIDFLKKVKLLSGMESYDIGQISDSLKAETLKQDEKVLNQGEPGDKFYFLVEGTLKAMKDEKEVMQYATGDYFGELALLKNQPRAASIVVTSPEAKVVSLDRSSFTRLIGPLQDTLNDNAKKYT